MQLQYFEAAHEIVLAGFYPNGASASYTYTDATNPGNNTSGTLTGGPTVILPFTAGDTITLTVTFN